MPEKEIIKEFVYSVKTEVDTSSMQKALEQMDSFIKSIKENVGQLSNIKLSYPSPPKTPEEEEKIRVKQEEARKKRQKEKEQLRNRQAYGRVISRSISGGVGGALNALVTANLFVASIAMISKIILDVGNKIVASTENLSNQMITTQSSFVNKGTRDIMFKYGVGSSTAMGMQQTFGALGIDSSDLYRLTPGQIKEYQTLMKYWKDGLDSINKTNLNKFSNSAQEFQERIAKIKLDKQLLFMRILADHSDTIERFYDATAKFLEGLLTVGDFFNNLWTELSPQETSSLVSVGETNSRNVNINVTSSANVSGTVDDNTLQTYKEVLEQNNKVIADSIKGDYES